MQLISTILSPTDWVGMVFSLPLTSLAIAALVAGGILVIAGARRTRTGTSQMSDAATRSIRDKYARERRVLGIAAIAMIMVFAVESMIRDYLLELPDLVSWWRFATPVASGFFALIFLGALITLRGSGASEMPVVTGARRTWVTFGPRAGLIACASVLLALAWTTVAAGIESSPDRHGRFIWLEVPIPNEPGIDPLRHWFYGWAYGAPVLVATAALAFATWWALHANAARPYIRPEATQTERALRTEAAHGTVAVASAGMLLALAGAWRLIASAASTRHLVVEGQNGGHAYDAIWRHAELGAVGGWIAPVLEIAAFTLLLLVAGKLRHDVPAMASGSRGDDLADAAEITT